MSVDNHKRKVVEALSSAFEAEYKAGQRRALPNLLMFCFKLDEPVPQWARRVFWKQNTLNPGMKYSDRHREGINPAQ